MPLDASLALLALAPAAYFSTLPGIAPHRSQLLATAGVAAAGFFLTTALVPIVAKLTHRRKMFGKDLCKKGTSLGDVEVPEALGLVPGVVFMMCVILLQAGTSAGATPARMLAYSSSLLSICFMMFLGFADDVLDLPWRYKLILPTVASMPLLCSYTGPTAVVIPAMMQPLLVRDGALTLLGAALDALLLPFRGDVDTAAGGAILELGWLYFAYMGLLAIFCTNAINILAGINGLEAGQSYVIGCAILAHNLLELSRGNEDVLFSATLIVPFLATTLALLRCNWYPSAVFVGDTYCYFAGMTFAVCAVQGKFSKTLLLFFVPQVLNFLYSCPQLFKLVPCPRHRLPKYDAMTNTLKPSAYEHPADKKEYPNMTILCAALRVYGPLHERKLCLVLLVFQALCCAAGFGVRYVGASQFYGDEMPKL